ncbi:hypothetical protein ACFV9G_22100 [Nocardioides sp. NPDC059952]|uniref:hypothetical protein n=1 Tax=Nocardioides sp. NPDC059952 TaxID=3347014 RepID=UPI003654DB17
MKKLPVIGAAAASLILVTPAAAQAAPPYDVAVGGSTVVGDHAFSAASVGGINFSTPLAAGNCTYISGMGQAHSGTSMSGNYTGNTPADHPFTIEASTWAGCTEQFGTPLDFTQVGEWRFTSQDPTATAAQTDTLSGTVSNVSFHIVDSSGTGLCDFWFTGSADAIFDETTQRLAFVEAGFDGSLSVENVSGNCLGMFAQGDPVDLQVSLSLSIPDGPLNIS